MNIGNKNNFSIEVVETSRNEPFVYGNICLWIKNQCIGYFNEVSYLETVVSSLKWVLENKNFVDYHHFGDTDEEVFYYLMNSEDELVFKAEFDICDTFDDWTIRIVLKNEELYFLWKYSEKPFYKYGEYDTFLHGEIVDRNILNAVLLELNKIVFKTTIC